MKYAIIAPEKLLTLTRFNGYQLVLATELLKRKDMMEWYILRREAGDIIILDNGAYEEGESISLDQLAKVAEELIPTHIVMPDARFDTEKTLHLTKKAVKKFENSVCSLLAVPQGNCLTSVIKCYEELVKIPAISGFGIYEEIGEVTGLGRRVDFCKYLQQKFLVQPNMFYHMLGCEENVADALSLRQFSWVQGIDSAKPIVYGLSMMQIRDPQNYTKYPHRPKNYFDIDATYLEYEHCLENVQWVHNMFRGEE